MYVQRDQMVDNFTAPAKHSARYGSALSAATLLLSLDVR